MWHEKAKKLEEELVNDCNKSGKMKTGKKFAVKLCSLLLSKIFQFMSDLNSFTNKSRKTKTGKEFAVKLYISLLY